MPRCWPNRWRRPASGSPPQGRGSPRGGPGGPFPKSKRKGKRKPSPRLADSGILIDVPLDWRRNLAALWLAELTAILGFSFAFPFLPLFLHRELHIGNGPELAFWSGIAAGTTGFA